MSTTTKTGLFYAYAKNLNDDWSSRYLITFANREVAELWYRLVIDSVAAGYNRFQGVSRISLQFFVHNPTQAYIPDTITDAKVALSLQKSICFTLLNDRNDRIQSVIPVHNYTQYVNGGRFFIRSPSQTNTYWYYNPSQKLVLSSQNCRTPFIIKMADPKRALGTTIIGTDDIYIMLDSGKNIGVVNTDDQLGPRAEPFPIKFSSFGSDFEVDYYFDGADPSFGTVCFSPGQGETWEVV